jgi:hypothetical protein
LFQEILADEPHDLICVPVDFREKVALSALAWKSVYCITYGIEFLMSFFVVY